ncbi:MAG: septal ring lytic transglycosylase RlpA family protein [Desulfohalobiaceae bacterium]
MILILVVLSACGPTFPVQDSAPRERQGDSPFGKEGFVQRGVASWYGPGFHGQQTANGETYDMYALTAAHKQLPFDSRIRVTNLDNGEHVVVRINDRGPFRKQRVLDLSFAAAQELDIVDPGTARVRIEKIGASREKSYSLQLGSFTSEKNARHVQRKARELGLSRSRVSEAELRGQRYYRVLVGRFASRSEAETARARVSSYFPESFILAD